MEIQFSLFFCFILLYFVLLLITLKSNKDLGRPSLD